MSLLKGGFCQYSLNARGGGGGGYCDFHIRFAPKFQLDVNIINANYTRKASQVYK